MRGLIHFLLRTPGRPATTIGSLLLTGASPRLIVVGLRKPELAKSFHLAIFGTTPPWSMDRQSPLLSAVSRGKNAGGGNQFELTAELSTGMGSRGLPLMRRCPSEARNCIERGAQAPSGKNGPGIRRFEPLRRVKRAMASERGSSPWAQAPSGKNGRGTRQFEPNLATRRRPLRPTGVQ